MAKGTKNAIRNEDGSIFQLTDVLSVLEYNRRFNKLAEAPRSGYDKYYNDNGFTNPQSPKGLSPQGIGKLMAILIEKAHETIRRGGTDATEMQTVLQSVLAYNEVAADEVAENAKQSVMAEALKVVGAEKLAQYVAEKGLKIDVPTATPTAAEPVAEVAVEKTVENVEPTETPTPEPTAEVAPETVETVEPEPQVVPEATVTEAEAVAASEEEPTEENTAPDVVPTAEAPALEVDQPKEVNEAETVETAKA